MRGRSVLPIDYAIELNQVTKSFAGTRALRGLDLVVERGLVCALLGPNGAGKSTTLRILFGLLKADSGKTNILGHHCWDESVAVRRKVGWVNAESRYPSWITGEKALRLRALAYSSKVECRGRELADRLNLDLSKPVSRLSRGNHQKVGLVLALAPGPELLLLDEPTSGLDPLLQETFAEIIKEETERGVTVLLSSHTFSEVERLCESVAVVKGGKVVAQESLESFRSKARRRVTLHVKGQIPEQFPHQFVLQRKSLDRLTGHWQGETTSLLNFINGLQVKDVEITAPLLDDAFLEHYT